MNKDLKEFNINDFVFLNKSIEQLNWRPGRFRPEPIINPIKMKIKSVTYSKSRGYIYQLKGISFDNSDINKIIFKTYSEALENMNSSNNKYDN